MQQTLPILDRDAWRVVAIALNDAGSGRSPASRSGWMGRLYRLLTGNEAPRPLADGRLEIVRRFVCSSRRLRRVDDRLLPALEAHGFSRAQVEALALLAR